MTDPSASATMSSAGSPPTPPTGPPTRTTGFVDSTDLLGSPAGLRARAAEHGYLFFRGLLPRQPILDVRDRFLDILAGYGWLADGHDFEDGVADVAAFAAVPDEEVEFCGVGIPRAAYEDVQRVRQFHELALHPRLLAVYRDLFGEAVLAHPRNIARVMIPGARSHPTPPHQDYIHIQGTPNVWTAWVPLGDCPRELGGLTVLDRSQHDGLLSYRHADGAGGLEAYLCNRDLAWAEGDFAAGDVLTFGSHTVHRALPNQRGERVRLSCDFRYQPVSEPLTDGSLRVHCDVLSWDDVYAGWPAGGIQWYWRDLALQHAGWDERLRWQKNRIC